MSLQELKEQVEFVRKRKKEKRPLRDNDDDILVYNSDEDEEYRPWPAREDVPLSQETGEQFAKVEDEIVYTTDDDDAMHHSQHEEEEGGVYDSVEDSKECSGDQEEQDEIVYATDDDDAMHQCQHEEVQDDDLYNSDDDKEYCPEEEEDQGTSSEDMEADDCQDAGVSEDDEIGRPLPKKRQGTSSEDMDADNCQDAGVSEDDEIGRPLPKKRQGKPKNRTQRVENPRKRFSCPILGCGASVIYLQRHMSQLHKDLSKENIRELIQEQKRPVKRKYRKKECGVHDCKWTGTRLERHLKSVHKMDKNEAKNMAKSINFTSDESAPARRQHVDLTISSVCDEFLTFYESIEGGHYIPQCIAEHLRNKQIQQNKRVKLMVQTLLNETLETEIIQPKYFMKLKTIGVSVDGKPSVVEKLKEGRTWGTVKNYLNCLSHFLDFLSFRNFPEIGSEDIDMIKQALKGCIKSVTNFAQYEVQKRKYDCRKDVISGELIAQYRKAKMSQEIISQSVKTIEQVRQLRNHILLDVQLCNGKRTGIYENLTLKAIHDAEKVANGYVALVTEGKTFKSSGAAGILFDIQQFAAIKCFINAHRAHFNPQTDQVFCKDNGQMSTTSDLCTFLQDGWAEFGRKKNVEVGKINFTLVRKSLVTLSRESGVDLETQRKMAAHMDHSIETANRFYDVSTGVQTTSVFRDILSSFAMYGDVEDNDVVGDEIEGSEEIDGSSWVLPSNNFGEGVSGTQTPISSDKMKKSFTDEQKDTVRNLFQENILKNKVAKEPIRKSEVSKVLNSCQKGKDLLEHFTLQQIYNRVRTEIRYH